MVSRQDARLNLSSLLSSAPGTESEVEGEGRLAPSAAELEAAGLRLDGPLDWRVTVRNSGGDDDFIAQGEVSGTAILECRRCLVDVPTEVRADFLYPMAYRPAQERDLDLIENGGGATDPEDPLAGEDVLAFGRPEVDFAPLLRQVFAIDLPLTVLCEESCRGLATDGVNLNDHPDHVVAGERDEESPFAALQDLDLEDDPASDDSTS